MDLEKTMELLRGEIEELDGALAEGSTTCIMFEAADVANFAMIVANIGLEAKNV
jgi:hypothetical protein